MIIFGPKNVVWEIWEISSLPRCNLCILLLREQESNFSQTQTPAVLEAVGMCFPWGYASDTDFSELWILSDDSLICLI